MHVEIGSLRGRFWINLHTYGPDDTATVAATHLVLGGSFDARASDLVVDLIEELLEDVRAPSVELTVTGVGLMQPIDAHRILGRALRVRRQGGVLRLGGPVFAESILRAADALGVPVLESTCCTSCDLSGAPFVRDPA